MKLNLVFFLYLSFYIVTLLFFNYFFFIFFDSQKSPEIGDFLVADIILNESSYSMIGR